MGAGLLLRTLTNLKSVELGFDPNKRTAVRSGPEALAGYKANQIHALNQELQEKFCGAFRP